MSAPVHDVEQQTARPFWLFWSASATSGLGTSITSVALPLVAVVALGASEFQMGLLAAASYVAWIFIGLPSGAIVRRLPLRGVQVTTDLVRGAAILSVPIAWWLDALSLGQLLIVALVISFADVIFDVANFTFLPRVVPKDQLHARNSLMSGTHAATELGGRSVGGVLVQLLGAVPTLIIDAISYAASAALLRQLPPTESEQSDHVEPIGQQIKDGWRFVSRHPIMRPCMWDATSINFICGAHHALLAIYLVNTVGAPPAAVGVLLAADGVGALAGAALSPAIVRTIGSARACLVAAAIAVVGAFLIPLGAGMSAYVLFAVGNVVFSAAVVVFSTATRTYRQIASPPDLLSRVMATVRFVSWAAIPIGGLLAGALASQIGARDALLVFAGLSVLSPLILWFSPVRGLRDFPES